MCRIAPFLLFIAALAPPQPATDVSLAPRSPGLIRVAVVGDVGEGTGRIATGIAKVHSGTPLDAILITGDNFYPCAVKSVTDPRWSIIRPLAAIGPPLFPVLGNHDYCGPGPAAEIGASLWSFPAAQYAIRSPFADFAMLDTTPLAERDSRLAENAIAPIFSISRVPWRIVVGHHVIESSGWHGYFRRTERRRMQRLLAPMRASHVDLYVCGHDHHMELLSGKPRILLSGAGSEPVPALALRINTLYPHTVRRALGFAVLEITPRSLTIRFFDGEGKQDGPPFVTQR
jgi:hypothetical protein